MLYMVTMRTLDNNNKAHTFVKVGKTHDWTKRLIPYLTHNPAIEVVGFHKGHTKAERDAHRRLLKTFNCTQVERFGRTLEWMEVSEDMTVAHIAQTMGYSA